MKKISSTKVLYIDTFSQNSAHEMFNASLILMCSMIFERMDCRISSSSYSNFLKITKGVVPENVKHEKLFVIEGESRFRLTMRYLVSTIQNIRYLAFSSKGAVIIFPFNNLFSLRIINFLNKFYRRKILIFCHSEMEGIVSSKKKGGGLHRILTKLAQNFFLNSNIDVSEGLYFSVLGDVLKNNIKTTLDDKKAIKFISMDHPYLFESIELKKENCNLNIATVGSISKVKGLLNFVEFAKKIKPQVREHLKISIIGSTHEDTKLLNESGIEFSSGTNKFLSREKMGKSLSELDYILFFYPEDSYRITASGAIMDAIYYEKPILALRNEYFEYLFCKFGKFGYLFSNIDEMVDRVEELYSNRLVTNFNFKDLKLKFSPESISKEFFKELNNIGFLKK